MSMCAVTPDRCQLTGAGLHQRHGGVGSSSLTVGEAPGEVSILLTDTQQGCVGICLHPDDADHFIERLRVATAIARDRAREADAA